MDFLLENSVLIGGFCAGYIVAFISFKFINKVGVLTWNIKKVIRQAKNLFRF